MWRDFRIGSPFEKKQRPKALTPVAPKPCFSRVDPRRSTFDCKAFPLRVWCSLESANKAQSDIEMTLKTFQNCRGLKSNCWGPLWEVDPQLQNSYYKIEIHCELIDELEFSGKSSTLDFFLSKAPTMTKARPLRVWTSGESNWGRTRQEQAAEALSRSYEKKPTTFRHSDWKMQTGFVFSRTTFFFLRIQ